MAGLVSMFGVSFLPEPSSALFDTMLADLAGLLDECRISHIEYDGVSPGYFSNGQWAYRKWLARTYASTDHPMSMGTGTGATRPFGYFEYAFNAVKKARARRLGPRGDSMSARIRTHHVSRPASTLDEAHMRLSQPAAIGTAELSLFFAVHYPSEWRTHGLLGEICEAAVRFVTEGEPMVVPIERERR